MENSSFYLHSGSMLVVFSAYIWATNKVQGYASFNMTAAGTLVQYIVSNQVNDKQNEQIFKDFNRKEICELVDRFHAKQADLLGRDAILKVDGLAVCTPALAMIALGSLVSRVGWKVAAMTQVYFGAAYHLIHTERPKRSSAPKPKPQKKVPKKDEEPALPKSLGSKTPNKYHETVKKRTEALDTKHILEFFNGESKGRCNHFIKQVLFEYDRDTIEDKHDFIQWLFPLTSKSESCPHAPILTMKAIEAFNKEDDQGEILRAQLHLGFVRMLDHFGLKINGKGEVAQNSKTFEYRKDLYLKPESHNLKRISRILASLVLLGKGKEAKVFYTFLDQYTQDDGASLRPTFTKYWQPIFDWDSI